MIAKIALAFVLALSVSVYLRQVEISHHKCSTVVLNIPTVKNCPFDQRMPEGCCLVEGQVISQGNIQGV